MVRQNFAGIDVSKHWFDCVVLVKQGQLHIRLPQSAEGFAQLDAWLANHGIDRIWVTLEHTGGYERGIAEHLQAQRHRVSLVPGLKIKRFKESLSIKSKTDPVDAYVIARFCKERRPELWIPRSSAYQELLELWRHRKDLVDGLTAWGNRRQAPKSCALSKHHASGMAALLQLQLEETEQAIRELVARHPEIARNVELLTTIGAVAFITAVGTLAEAGPIECYPTPESLALAAGVAPIPCCSGTSVQGTYRKPYGNQNLRRVLNLAGANARRFDPGIRQFAERIAKRGAKSPSTLNRACVRKLLHIMWGVIHSKQPYDPAKAIQGYIPTKA
jgi:transposase